MRLARPSALDGPLDLVAAAHQWIDPSLTGHVVQIAGEFGQGVTLPFSIAPFGLALAFGLPAGLVLLALLGDAVGQVVDDVEAGDVLLVEEVDRVRVFFSEDRHQYVRAGDLLLARGLHVIDGALQHALEAQRRLGVATVIFGQARHGGFDRLLEIRAQAVGVRTGRLQDGLRRGIFQ